jgi:hypothetical protein
MTYDELKKQFHNYRIGKIKRNYLVFAIGLWQRTEYGHIPEMPYSSFMDGSVIVKWRNMPGIEVLYN